MKEPMDVPPTKSTGTPASSNAFSTPMCEQPLQQEGNLVTNWESPRPYPPEKSLLPSPQLAKNEVPAPPLWESHQWSKLHLSNTLVTPLLALAPHHHLAPPPPSTRAMVLPVSTLASLEKSLCRSARLEKTFSYSSCWDGERETAHEDGVAGGSTWTSMAPSPHVVTLCPSRSPTPQVAMP